jgi:hypothetical protein
MAIRSIAKSALLGPSRVTAKGIERAGLSAVTLPYRAVGKGIASVGRAYISSAEAVGKAAFTTMFAPFGLIGGGALKAAGSLVGGGYKAGKSLAVGTAKLQHRVWGSQLGAISDGRLKRTMLGAGAAALVGMTGFAVRGGVNRFVNIKDPRERDPVDSMNMVQSLYAVHRK